jgi:hypothetical protein
VIIRLAFLVVLTHPMLMVSLSAVAWADHDRNENSHEAPLYYEVQSLNEGLPELDDQPDLTPPRDPYQHASGVPSWGF